MNRDNLTIALTGAHAEAHELMERVAAMIDRIDPDTANWGHVSDLGRIIDCLRVTLGDNA